MGTKQSGVPMLKIADLTRDEMWLVHAKKVAEKLIQEHPQAVEAHLTRWMSQGVEWVKV